MINRTKIGQASSGPAAMNMDRNAMVAQTPFVVAQVMFPGTATQVKMGQGLAAKVAFASASTNVTVTHNLGHPIQMLWAAMAPPGVFIPKVMIATGASSNTAKQVVIQSDTVAASTVVVMF